MNMSIKKRNNIESFLDYFTALMLILNCQSVFQNSIQINFRIYELTLFSIIINSIYKLFHYKITRDKLKSLITISNIYLCYILIFSFICVSFEQLSSFWGRYICLPFVILIFSVNNNWSDKINIFRCFINVVVVISAISLFFWIFGSTLDIIPANGSMVCNWGNNIKIPNYYNLYFETQYVDWLGISFFVRNTGIFIEGPMFALVLILALIFSYYFKDTFETSRLKVAVIIITIITTFSTSALIFLALYLYVSLAENPKFKKLKIIIIFFAGLGFILMVTYFLLKKSETGSYSLRMDDYKVGFETWIQSPIWGHGYGDYTQFVKNMSSFRASTGFSNSIFSILGQGGIMYFLMYGIPLSVPLLNLIKGVYDKMNLFLVVSYILILAVIICHTAFFNFFIWTLLVYSNSTNHTYYFIKPEKNWDV